LSVTALQGVLHEVLGVEQLCKPVHRQVCHFCGHIQYRVACKTGLYVLGVEHEIGDAVVRQSLELA